MDLDRPRRKLASLQPMIEAYSRRAWYTVPSARQVKGVDPNAPREPAYYGVKVRLAARVVDERLGGNPANLGKCDCEPCGCELRHDDGSYRCCEHDLACPHVGEEDSEQVSARLRILAASQSPTLAKALGSGGVDAVYVLADLTPAETQVARYHHEGLSYASIAFLTNRQIGTAKALYNRASYKLTHLVAVEEELAA